MKNKEIFKKFTDETHIWKVEKLFWIAVSLESKNLHELLSDMEDSDAIKEVLGINDIEDYEEDYTGALLDNEKFGFLVELYIPKCYNFKFNPGKSTPWSWSSSNGVCTIKYAYAETLDELYKKIEEIGKSTFQKFIQYESQK